VKAPVFLSASEPYKTRSREYLESQNLANIRAAIRALCAHVLPFQPLVYGGHPAISPLVDGIASRIYHDRLRTDPRAPRPQLLRFVSRRFSTTAAEGVALTDTHDRDGNVVPPNGWSRSMSLLRMRYEMLGVPGCETVAPPLRSFSDGFGELRKMAGLRTDFTAAVFVGGMEGVEREFRIFRTFHPRTPTYVLASTGAAASRLLPELGELPIGLNRLLTEETAYGIIFQELLPLAEQQLDVRSWRPPFVRYDWEQHLDPEELERD
jgi:hypothetical protein